MDRKRRHVLFVCYFRCVSTTVYDNVSLESNFLTSQRYNTILSRASSLQLWSILTYDTCFTSTYSREEKKCARGSRSGPFGHAGQDWTGEVKRSRTTRFVTEDDSGYCKREETIINDKILLMVFNSQEIFGNNQFRQNHYHSHFLSPHNLSLTTQPSFQPPLQAGLPNLLLFHITSNQCKRLLLQTHTI